jgi:hypothetical protein
MVKPGDWIDLGMFNAKSVAFERELTARKDELSDIVCFTAVSLPPIPENAYEGSPWTGIYVY